MKLKYIKIDAAMLYLRTFYNNQIVRLDAFIDKQNLRTILLTTLIILFSLFSTLKVWDARIVKTDSTVELQIPNNATINQPVTFNAYEGVLLQSNTIEQPMKVTISKKAVKSKITSKELEFISDIAESAIAEAKIYNIPASIKISQAIIESGWGEDAIAIENNNHYGLKYKSTFSKEELKLVAGRMKRTTSEYVNLKKLKTVANFAVYPTRWNSIRHHSIFLRERIDAKFNEGYAAMEGLSKTQYKKWAKALEKSGYSTNPLYAEHLIKIIEKYKLYKYDR